MDRNDTVWKRRSGYKSGSDPGEHGAVRREAGHGGDLPDDERGARGAVHVAAAGGDGRARAARRLAAASQACVQGPLA